MAAQSARFPRAERAVAWTAAARGVRDGAGGAGVPVASAPASALVTEGRSLLPTAKPEPSAARKANGRATLRHPVVAAVPARRLGDGLAAAARPLAKARRTLRRMRGTTRDWTRGPGVAAGEEGAGPRWAARRKTRPA